jgi:Uncharacterized protein family, UPF0114
LERLLFNSRWLMAPFYLALVVSLAVLFSKFGLLLFEFVLHVQSAKESDVILGVLSLIDVTLTGNPDCGVFRQREFRLKDRSGRPSELAGRDDQGRLRRAGLNRN